MSSVLIGNVKGPPGTRHFVTASDTASAGSARPGDYFINGGEQPHNIGGVPVPVGGLARVTSVNPFACTVDGNIRGSKGDTGSGIRTTDQLLAEDSVTVLPLSQIGGLQPPAREGDLVLSSHINSTGALGKIAAIDGQSAAVVPFMNIRGPAAKVVNFQEFFMSDTFTVPAGVDVIYITACGGGGAGDHSSPSTPRGGGGGGGAAVVRRMTEVVPGQQIPITIGLGGNVPTANGQSTIIGNILTLPGGGGGNASGGGIGGSGGGDGGTPINTGTPSDGKDGLLGRGGDGGAGSSSNGGSATAGIGGTGGVFSLVPAAVAAAADGYDGNLTGGGDGVLGGGGGGGGYYSSSSSSNFASGGGGGSLGGGGGGAGRAGYSPGKGGDGYCLIEW